MFSPLRKYTASEQGNVDVIVVKRNVVMRNVI